MSEIDDLASKIAAMSQVNFATETPTPISEEKCGEVAAAAINHFLKTTTAPATESSTTKPLAWSDPASEIAGSIRPKLELQLLAGRLVELELPDIQFVVAMHRQVREGQELSDQQRQRITQLVAQLQ